MTKFEVALQKEFEDQRMAIKKPNLAIVGGTGVGKSSLINRIFGKNAAKAGVGAPITKGMTPRGTKQQVQMSKTIQILNKI